MLCRCILRQYVYRVSYHGGGVPYSLCSSEMQGCLPLNSFCWEKIKGSICLAWAFSPNHSYSSIWAWNFARYFQWTSSWGIGGKECCVGTRQCFSWQNCRTACCVIPNFAKPNGLHPYNISRWGAILYILFGHGAVRFRKSFLSPCLSFWCCSCNRAWSLMMLCFRFPPSSLWRIPCQWPKLCFSSNIVFLFPFYPILFAQSFYSRILIIGWISNAMSKCLSTRFCTAETASHGKRTRCNLIIK